VLRLSPHLAADPPSPIASTRKVARALLGSRRRRRASGFVASIVAVAAVTAAIELFRPAVPVLALGVLYLFAVLPIAIVWGRAYAIPVSAASVLALNWFFLPPLYTFTLADKENWFALVVYLVTGVLVSDLATRARDRARDAEQREREAALLAELSSALLSGAEVASELDRIAYGAASVLGVERARLDLGRWREPRSGESPFELRAGDKIVGTLYVRGGAWSNLATRRRFLPALASLLAVALDRERLARKALEAEALRRSDAVKTAVLRAVSHDLRSPLTAIRVAFEGLASTSLELSPEDRAGLLETARLELSRLERLVGDLLDLSRLQAGAAVPEPEVWTVEELISQALEALGGQRERVDVVLPDETPPVRVDAVQVERVLVNLLENGLKFSPPRAIVRVRVASIDDDVILRVVDEGSGLPEEELERVFEPFHQALGRGERRGSGLGLAIARGFAEANAGRVWAESRPGQGATFALALPAAPAPVGVEV
jgi:two-component system sensor histidine kinase KdpD